MIATPPTDQRDWLFDFPPSRSLPLDQEALRVYERAYHIGLSTETETEPPITFSTVALALLTGKDETSQWFAEVALTCGPTLQGILDEKKATDSALTSAEPPPGRPPNLRLSTDTQLLTTSARAVLQTAEEWANRVGGSDIGVRHLVASYVLNPPAAHRKQMNDWGFDELAWRERFFDWAAKRYTAESWADASQKVAPTKAVAAFEQLKVKGAALAFPGDPQAVRVLERAAEYHAGLTDTWLRLRTVLFALVEQVRSDDALRDAIAPFWTAVQPIASRYQAAFEEYLPPKAARREFIPFDALDISPRVLNGLETARGLALATRHEDGRVGVLHLAAALLSPRVDGDEDWAAMGLDAQRLRRELVEHAVRRGEPGEAWRETLGEEEAVTAGRTVDLNSDEPEAVVRSDEKWTSDPLGIRPDVASFAALLASKSLEPPLAIGLFGPWGSGKTTFLKRLRRAVDERAGQAKAASDAGRPTPFASNVVHVEFNAWHFAEDALISSLIDTIVRELRAFIKGDYPLVGEALANLKAATAESVRRRAELARQGEAKARDAVTAAERKVAESEAKARQAAVSLKAAAQAARTAALATLRGSSIVRESRVLEGVEDSITSLEDLQTRVQAIRSRPARLMGELGLVPTLLFAGMALALPPAAGWLVNRVLGIGEVGGALTSAGAILSVVGVWGRTASGAMSRVDRALAAITKAYEDRIRDDPGVKAAEAEHEGATVAAAAAAATLADAQRELRKAEADAAAASLPAQMLTLVSGRADDRTYAKELTTVSVARGDLQMLSEILRDQARAPTAALSGVRPVERVILYIDDLDRCRPEDVVRVLQVVHMLLAFELFVVVVAVDARWVEESLRQNYRWLAGADVTAARVDEGGEGAAAEASAHVTPQDYLEKIFQISFWLEPMSAARAAEYLKSLVRTPRGEPESAAGPPAEPSRAPSGSTSSEAGGVEIPPIEPIELDYMRALAAYVGPSPRRVKRLVNAYRLLKARLSDAQLRSFVTNRSADEGGLRSGPYQLAIGLLVIGTGAPASAAQILGELGQRNPADGLDKVIESFRERNQPDWTMAAQVLETLMRTQKAKDVSELRGWARRVGRFLLRGPAEVSSQRNSVI